MTSLLENLKWVGIEGYPDYQISNTGKVKNITTRTILKEQRNHNGYYRVGLCYNKIRSFYYIHRLMAKAFIVNPDNKPQVDHIDNNKMNDSVNNLRWATHQENQMKKQKTTKHTTSKYICWVTSHKKKESSSTRKSHSYSYWIF